MRREISAVGKEMLLFQERLAEEYGYKPVPLSLFTGNVREKYEAALPQWCLDEANRSRPLYSADGTMLSTGYSRIVIGDYGAFVEVAPGMICSDALMCRPGQEYRYRDERYAKNIKYLWLTAKDASGCKIYLQKRMVDYADYVPGMYYISPYEVFLTKN